MALVTKVVTNGPAHSAGVRVGDYVVALNGRPATDYDEVVALFARAPRPLRLTVRRFGDAGAGGVRGRCRRSRARRDARADAMPPAPPNKSAAFGGAPPPSTEPEAARDAPETAPPPPAPPPPPDSPPTPRRKPPEPEVLEASFGPGPLGPHRRPRRRRRALRHARGRGRPGVQSWCQSGRRGNRAERD